MPEDKYYDSNLEKLVEQGAAQVIEINKSFKIDKDTMYIKRIINTNEKTYIRYSLIIKEMGWSFPETTIKIIDDKNNEYQCYGASSAGKPWGQEGLFQTDRISDGTKEITIKYQWFDRQNQMRVLLDKEGEAYEK